MRIYGNGPIVVVLVMGAFATTPATASVVSQRQFCQSYALRAGGRVVIDNLYGDVRISAWDRDEVRIQAIKSASDSSRLDDARIVVDSTSDTLSVYTQYGGLDAEHPASVEYHINVPRTANLEAVRLVNGGLSIRGLQGAVKATSINGDIRAELLEGTADLSTINGQVAADFQRISADKAISLRSVNGPIVLSIPPNAGAQVNARNRSGGIQTDFGRRELAQPGHRLQTTLKGGGAHIRLETINGGISIRASWSRKHQRLEM